jgi:hypothetical protein
MTDTNGGTVVWCACRVCHRPLLARLPVDADLSRVTCPSCKAK